MMTSERVLAFWFGDGPVARRIEWFGKAADFDTACGAFTEVLSQARVGALDDWADTPHGALGLIVLLDQLSRNIHRGTPLSFAADPSALSIARNVVAQGWDRQLVPLQRMFAYLPFEHSEALADQDESVRLFESMRGELEDDTISYAARHRDVIRRFGRFPHRNAILGRVNTPEETVYLAEPGSGF